MNTFSIAPLMRTSIGFDRLEQLFDQAFNGSDLSGGFPHYNILKVDENQYRITLAVAGFGRSDIDITQKQNFVMIKGEVATDDGLYLHRGIASRKFERRFQLADHVEVSSAGMENGLLHIDLVRKIPKELQPKKISISELAPETIQAA